MTPPDTATPARPTYQSAIRANISALNCEPSNTPNTATMPLRKRGQETRGAPDIAAIVTNDMAPSIQGSGNCNIKKTAPPRAPRAKANKNLAVFFCERPGAGSGAFVVAELLEGDSLFNLWCPEHNGPDGQPFALCMVGGQASPERNRHRA